MRQGPPLVLGSSSPRRHELLLSIGLPHDIVPADVEEPAPGSMPPRPLVEESALLKARAVAARLPGRLVLGADTVVVLGDPDAHGEVLGKPADAAGAERMLRRLSGRRHDVLTAVARLRDEMEVLHTGRTDVSFAELERGFIERYVATGEPLDKAGAYGAQGFMGPMVRRVEGSWTNVVGLPLELLPGLFAEAGESLAAWQDW